MKYSRKAPSEKQIIFAERIAKKLNINFPTCSKEYTQYSYYHFIKAHINEYKWRKESEIWDDEDFLNWIGLYENDVWCEHY